MSFLLYGFLALALAVVALHGFSHASVAILARQLRISSGLVALLLAALLMTRGATGPAIALAAIAVTLLGFAFGRGRMTSSGSQTPAAGRTSRIVTDHLEMELDLDSGAIRGRVLAGMFVGRAIESLAPAELALLWQDCRHTDPRSATVIEAYLDGHHPTWREDSARGEAHMASEPGGRMSPAEARRILGVDETATAAEVKHAHRELMQRLHPDHGGSNYLAAKVNEAKDVLLDEFDGGR